MAALALLDAAGTAAPITAAGAETTSIGAAEEVKTLTGAKGLAAGG